VRHEGHGWRRRFCELLPQFDRQVFFIRSWDFSRLQGRYNCMVDILFHPDPYFH
jgi:hypothetical protein